MNSQFTPIPGTMLAINWAAIPIECKFVTVDQSGRSMAWQIKPDSHSKYWVQPKGDCYALVFKFERAVFDNWQALIFERPN